MNEAASAGWTIRDAAIVSSLVVGASGLIHTLWQARAARLHNESIRLREILSEIGVRAYLWVWTSLANPLSASALSHLRQAISAELGDGDDLRGLLSDQSRLEGLVHSAWRTASGGAHEEAASKVAASRARLAERYAWLHGEIESLEAMLRLQFTQSTLVVGVARTSLQEFLASDDGHDVDSLIRFLRPIADSKASSEKGISDLSKVATSLSQMTDVEIRKLRYISNGFLGNRLLAWRVRQDAKSSHKRLDDIHAAAVNFFPKQSRALGVAIHAAKRDAEKAAWFVRAKSKVMKAVDDSRLRISGTGAGSSGLAPHVASMLDRRIASCWSDSKLVRLLELKAEGIDDCNVDAVLSVHLGDTELLQDALNRGPSLGAGFEDVIERHRDVISGSNSGGFE